MSKQIFIMIKEMSLSCILSLVVLTPQIIIVPDVFILGKEFNLDYFLAFVGLGLYCWSYFFDPSRELLNRRVLSVSLGVVFLGLTALIFTRDISYIRNFLFLIKNMAKFYLFYYISAHSFKNKDSWSILSYSLLPFLLTSILFQLNPSIAKTFFLFTTYSAESISKAFITSRISWAGFSTWEYTIIFSFILCSKIWNSKLTPSSVLLTSLLLLGSVMFGRSWVVILPVFILFSSFNLTQASKTIVFLIADFLIVLAITWLVYVLLFSQVDYFNWIWEFFFRLIKSNEIGTASVKELTEQNVAFVQNYSFAWREFLFGHGKYTVIRKGVIEYFGRKDSGYIRQLLCTGVIFSAIIYSSICFYVYKSSLYRNNRKLALFLLVTTLVLQIKGDIIFFCFGYYFLFELFEFERNHSITRSSP